jgi:hypothetical protein
MNFKEWFANEQRFKGLKRSFDNQNPDMPSYVKKDLYNTRIAHTMNKLTKNNTSSGSFNSGFERTSTSLIPSDSATKIFQSSEFKNLKWNKQPEILKTKGVVGVNPLSFNKVTQEYFIRRFFGFKPEESIRNDNQRMQTQIKIHTQKGEGNNEPVIVQLTMNGYKLIEGWHRTMTILLSGCPEDQLESMRNLDLTNLNFSLWKPVKLLAYVGYGEEIERAIQGTGKMDNHSDSF